MTGEDNVEQLPEWVTRLLAMVTPTKVRIPIARWMLGGKSKSEVYVMLGDGRLTGSRDGHTALIDVDSIQRHLASLPPLKIKPLNRDRRARLHQLAAERRKRRVRR
jgi:hypothetical protein